METFENLQPLHNDIYSKIRYANSQFEFLEKTDFKNEDLAQTLHGQIDKLKEEAALFAAKNMLTRPKEDWLKTKLKYLIRSQSIIDSKIKLDKYQELIDLNQEIEILIEDQKESFANDSEFEKYQDFLNSIIDTAEVPDDDFLKISSLIATGEIEIIETGQSYKYKNKPYKDVSLIYKDVQKRFPNIGKTTVRKIISDTLTNRTTPLNKNMFYFDNTSGHLKSNKSIVKKTIQYCEFYNKTITCQKLIDTYEDIKSYL